jgi:hypothetical protein
MAVLDALAVRVLNGTVPETGTQLSLRKFLFSVFAWSSLLPSSQ